MNENEVMAAPVSEQVNVVAQQENPVVVDDNVDAGHKVIFYVILGLIGVSGIGLPVVIWLLIREHKKRKQLEDTLNAQTATTVTPATAETQAPAAESQETKPAEATPEQK